MKKITLPHAIHKYMISMSFVIMVILITSPLCHAKYYEWLDDVVKDYTNAKVIKNTETKLTLPVYDGCKKTKTYRFKYTPKKAGSYYFNCNYTSRVSGSKEKGTLTLFHPLGSRTALCMEDYCHYSFDFKRSNKRTTGVVVTLDAGETAYIELEVDLENITSESQSELLLKIDKCHTGDHVLSKPVLKKYTYGLDKFAEYNIYLYRCYCTLEDCTFYSEKGIAFYGISYGSNRPEIEYESSLHNARQIDNDNFEEMYTDSSEKREAGYDLVFTKTGTEVGDTLEGVLSTNSLKHQALEGNDFFVSGHVVKCEIDLFTKIKLNTTSYTYDGKEKKPSIKYAKNGIGQSLVEGRDYTVAYSTGCKNVGTYYVTLKGKGNYKGSTKLSFKILPLKTHLTSLVASSKAFTAKWKAQMIQTSGYKLRYSTHPDMSDARCRNISDTSKTSKKVTNLKAKKKYYVQVRTYKYNYKSDQFYYSPWSEVKSVTTN